jgi:molybdopterin-containing oxidoreductase family membrane subunit
MWTSAVLAIVALALLLLPGLRRSYTLLSIACVAVVVSIWIEKGLGMVVTGFVPSPLGHVTPYWPTVPEVFIGLGIYAFGALLITVFYKVALSVRGQLSA